MKTFAGFISALMVATGAPTLASAQAAPAQKTVSVATVQKMCEQRWGEQGQCKRIADQARSRYGENVTAYQWQSAVGVIRNKVRQGK